VTPSTSPDIHWLIITEFSLQAAHFNFHATGYQWLVVAGAQAIYKGQGMIDGHGLYDFIVSVMDGDSAGKTPDAIRIRIWAPATGEILYDNQPDDSDDADAATILGGGNIAVHK